MQMMQINSVFFITIYLLIVGLSPSQTTQGHLRAFYWLREEKKTHTHNQEPNKEASSLLQSWVYIFSKNYSPWSAS